VFKLTVFIKFIIILLRGNIMALSPILRGIISKFVKQESAVTAIEYALIASLIAIVIITAVKLVGTNLTAVFNTIAAAL
jgi:pilus assembly protein Flp/PilA